MDGVSYGIPECDSIDIRIMKECNGEKFIRLTDIALFVGIPKTFVWHRLTVLEKFGYVESDPKMEASYYKTTAKGKEVTK